MTTSPYFITEEDDGTVTVQLRDDHSGEVVTQNMTQALAEAFAFEVVASVRRQRDAHGQPDVWATS